MEWSSGGPRIAIDARLVPGEAGGIEQGIIQLVSALAAERNHGPTYSILVDPRAPTWLDSYLGPNQQAIAAPKDPAREQTRIEATLAEMAWRFAGPAAKRLAPFWHRFVLEPRRRRLAEAMLSRRDQFVESLDVEVLHVPLQRLVNTTRPVIFEPWDLQHRHLPQFFSDVELAEREVVYVTACRRARAIVVASDWVRNDLVRELSLSRDKVFHIRRGPPVAHYGPPPTVPKLKVLSDRLALPGEFVFVPAQTWPHKNHLMLLKAIALLRDQYDVRIPVVCSGRLTRHYDVIRRSVDDLGLRDQVRFLGFVSQSEVRALYRLATVLAMPSLFEGYGFPVLEAFHEGLAVACSDVTSLSEVAGDAALFFDPGSVESIANALRTVWLDGKLRADLVCRGYKRLQLFDDSISAETYRALYRQVAGYSLSIDDHILLNAAQVRHDRVSGD
jgi:glycosyltransferase involved in cell wall biosynthesis